MTILATFTDLKPIKGRKVVQIVLEAPMEKAVIDCERSSSRIRRSQNARTMGNAVCPYRPL